MSSSPTTLKVEGLACCCCARKVTRALERLPGVESFALEQSEGRATIIYDDTQIMQRGLPEAVRRAGYDATIG